MYGDIENVKKDFKTVKEILLRQGTNFIIHVIAEVVGESNLKFKYTEEEVKRIIEKNCQELKESILERT